MFNSSLVKQARPLAWPMLDNFHPYPVEQNCSDCPTADLSNIGRPNGPDSSTGEQLNMPQVSFLLSNQQCKSLQAWLTMNVFHFYNVVSVQISNKLKHSTTCREFILIITLQKNYPNWLKKANGSIFTDHSIKQLRPYVCMKKMELHEKLSRHLHAAVCIRMQTFSKLSEFLTISCFHKNFMTLSQTVRELPHRQTKRHYWKHTPLLRYHCAGDNQWQKANAIYQCTEFLFIRENLLELYQTSLVLQLTLDKTIIIKPVKQMLHEQHVVASTVFFVWQQQTELRFTREIISKVHMYLVAASFWNWTVQQYTDT